MLELIIVVLLVLWLVGYFGPTRFPRIPNAGNFVHVLIVLAVVLVIAKVFFRA
jgi:hypothetical protein